MRRRLHRLRYRLIGLLKWRQASGLLQAYRREVLGLPQLPWAGARNRPDPQACVPEPALQAFLEAGPAPFYAGFGSMSPADPDRLAAEDRVATAAGAIEAQLPAGLGAP